jgi:prepilin-type N-terminal cleavage/methylation domain-containing protein
MTSGLRPRLTHQRGFTFVEIVVALVLFSIGILALSGITAATVRMVSMSGVRTDRALALRSAIEQVKFLPYDSVDFGEDSVGLYSTTWTTLSMTHGKRVHFVMSGPGLRRGEGPGAVAPTVVDTFVYTIAKP